MSTRLNGKAEGPTYVWYGDGWKDAGYVPLKAGQTLYSGISPDSNGTGEDDLYLIKATGYKVPIPTITKASGKKRSATLQWKRSGHASGYQIRYSTSSGMKGAKTKRIEGASKTKTTLKKLKSGKRYYVQARAYYNAGSWYSPEYRYFSWSGTKSVKTK